MNGKVVPIIIIVTVVGLIALLFDDPGVEGVIQVKPRIAPGAGWIPATESLSPNESLVAATEMPVAMEPQVEPARAPAAKPAPVKRKPIVRAERRTFSAKSPDTTRSRIQVEGRRLTGDPSLQRAAISAIARVPNLSGRISVESRGQLVRLSGWTTTAGQSLRVEKAVAAVKGVRGVENQIRPRVGAITS